MCFKLEEDRYRIGYLEITSFVLVVERINVAARNAEG
jgi:hypothetical protein